MRRSPFRTHMPRNKSLRYDHRRFSRTLRLHRTNDRLPASFNVHVLDDHPLGAAGAEPVQGDQAVLEGPHHLG